MVKPIDLPPSAPRLRAVPATEKLRREILTGRYAPGTRLPPERELAVRLGTNRNTLREALRTLESENLLRSRQGDGTLVLDWRVDGEMSLLPHFLAEGTPPADRFEALYTLYRLRDALVDHALFLAVGHTTDADIAALRGALATLGSVEPGTRAAVSADVELYRQIVLTTRVNVLVWVFNTYARILRQLGDRYPQLWSFERRYVDALDEVVRAIAQADQARARRLMREVLELQSGVALVKLAPDGKFHDRAKPRNAAPRSKR